MVSVQHAAAANYSVAAANPAKVSELQAVVVKLSQDMVQPHFLINALEATLSPPPNFPDGLGSPSADH